MTKGVANDMSGYNSWSGRNGKYGRGDCDRGASQSAREPQPDFRDELSECGSGENLRGRDRSERRDGDRYGEHGESSAVCNEVDVYDGAQARSANRTSPNSYRGGGYSSGAAGFTTHENVPFSGSYAHKPTHTIYLPPAFFVLKVTKPTSASWRFLP